MAATPYFHWPHHSSDVVAGFGSGGPEMAPATTASADSAALVSPDQHAVAARPRVRRNSYGSGKQQQKGVGGAKKPSQRGLGVAELERLRCGGDPLLELAGAQVHPLMHCNHHHRHHHHVPAPAFDAANARYCSSPLVEPPPAPAAPVCYVHHPAAPGCQRAPDLEPEQQYFMDRWGRMGPGFNPAGNGAGGDHQAQLLPPLAPEHPSSQSTIWRPAASSSSCLQSGHRCDLCARRMMRAFVGRGAPPPSAPPPSPTATNVPDYSIYELAAAMATARQGDAAFLVRDRKRGALTGEAPATQEVREIEFFPAASTHPGGGTGLDESEFVAPVSSSYGAGSRAAAPPLDLSLRL